MADAFDKFKSSLNRGITTISVKTSSTLEKTKLKTHIESLGNEVQKMYASAGEIAYGKWIHHDADCSELEHIFLEIQRLQKTIAERSEELNSIDERDSQILGHQSVKHAAILCPNCGTGYSESVRFCRNCGFKMQSDS